MIRIAAIWFVILLIERAPRLFVRSQYIFVVTYVWIKSPPSICKRLFVSRFTKLHRSLHLINTNDLVICLHVIILINGCNFLFKCKKCLVIEDEELELFLYPIPPAKGRRGVSCTCFVFVLQIYVSSYISIVYTNFNTSFVFITIYTRLQ